MKLRETLPTLVVLLAIGLAGLFFYRHEQRRQSTGMCVFCDRMVHAATAYRVKMGGQVLTACCPRCGMRAEVNREKGKPGQAWATDVNTGERVAADSATYVEGGDVQYCTHDDQTVAREPDGVSVRQYDRCLPTLVAFKTPQEAQIYRQKHGGRVLTYPQALDSVRQQ